MERRILPLKIIHRHHWQSILKMEDTISFEENLTRTLVQSRISPKFISFFDEGVWTIQCLDEHLRGVIIELLPTFRNIRIAQEDAECIWDYKAIFPPNREISDHRIFSELGLRNIGLRTNRWRVVFEEDDGVDQGIVATFSVDSMSHKYIQEHDGILLFEEGVINLEQQEQ